MLCLGFDAQSLGVRDGSAIDLMSDSLQRLSVNFLHFSYLHN